MKQLLLVLALVTVGANAATVKSAKYDAKQDALILDVVYSGGCGDHEFSFEYGPCMETFPAQTWVQLIEKTDDRCEAILHRTIAVSIEGLDGCRPAYVSVRGDGESKANVFVPEK